MGAIKGKHSWVVRGSREGIRSLDHGVKVLRRGRDTREMEEKRLSKMCQDNGLLREMMFQLWQDTKDAREVGRGRLAKLG